MFIVEDELHAERQGEFDTFEAAILELKTKSHRSAR